MHRSECLMNTCLHTDIIRRDSHWCLIRPDDILVAYTDLLWNVPVCYVEGVISVRTRINMIFRAGDPTTFDQVFEKLPDVERNTLRLFISIPKFRINWSSCCPDSHVTKDIYRLQVSTNTWRKACCKVMCDAWCVMAGRIRRRKDEWTNFRNSCLFNVATHYFKCDSTKQSQLLLRFGLLSSRQSFENLFGIFTCTQESDHS